MRTGKVLFLNNECVLSILGLRRFSRKLSAAVLHREPRSTFVCVLLNLFPAIVPIIVFTDGQIVIHKCLQ